jgi:hypothetical protein
VARPAAAELRRGGGALAPGARDELRGRDRRGTSGRARGPGRSGRPPSGSAR